MKTNTPLSSTMGLLVLCASPAFAQTVEVDPVDPLTNSTTLGSWNTNGDQEGWTTNQLTPVVEGGLLKATAEGGDPFLVLNPIDPAIPTGQPSLVVVEFELQRSATDVSGIQVFWDDNIAGGFAAVRSLTLPENQVPTDGLPHVYRFNLNNVNTSLLGIRIDASTTSGTELELDYVNVQVTSGSPVIDPPTLINKFVSLGEWNTPDDFESWTTNAQVSSPSVGSGLLSGTSSGNDPQVILANIDLDTDNGENQIIEMRLRRQASETGRIDLFWSDEAGGYGGPRRTIIPDNAWPTDGEFHIVQFPLGEFISGNLGNLRFDPVANNPSATTFDLDYVRIGIIDADEDNDGLANSVETNTGTFNGPDDTGTDPNDDDSDNDNFLDGVEVTFGTDPNDANDFPTPTLVSYSGAPASYIVAVAITDNLPTVANGDPLGFSVSPPLPAGLQLDSITGVISGTATTAADSAVYTITANFSGDLTSTYDLTLEVLNPGISSYQINTASYEVNQEVTANSPTTFGATPAGFSIAPPLPTGLLLDGTTGIVTGTPTEVSTLTEYTITANYGGNYPDATFALNIQIKAIPVFIGSDNAPLSSFTSLAEWETEGDLEGWTPARATATVANGFLNFAATGADPQLFKNAIVDSSQGEILEIRLRQNDSERFQLFWADASGGFAGGRSFAIPSTEIIPDGEFHVYQVDMTGVFVGEISSFRFDPGDIAGRTVDIDYIRLGTPAPPAAPVVSAFSYDAIFDEISITWSSDSGATYRIESSSDLDTWIEVVDGLQGENGSTTYLGPDNTTDRFFRVVRKD